MTPFSQTLINLLSSFPEQGLFAYIGFLTFGDETQEVITNNLPTRGFKTIVNVTLVAKALLSFPLPFFAVTQLLEQALFRAKPKTLEEKPDGEGPQPFPTCWGRDNDLRVWALTLRVLLVLFTMFMASKWTYHFSLPYLTAFFVVCQFPFRTLPS